MCRRHCIHSDSCSIFLGCFGLAVMCARCVCGCSVESICLIHSSAAVPSLCLYSYKLISCFIYEALSSSLFSMCLLFYFFLFLLLLVFSFASGVDIDIQKNTNTIPDRESNGEDAGDATMYPAPEWNVSMPSLEVSWLPTRWAQMSCKQTEDDGVDADNDDDVDADSAEWKMRK